MKDVNIFYAQMWKILLKKLSFNTMPETKEEIIGVYIKEECSITSRMGKYGPERQAEK